MGAKAPHLMLSTNEVGGNMSLGFLKEAADKVGGHSLKQAKDDKVEFIKSIGRDLERYVKELALGEISKQEFEDLVKDLASLEKIECRRLSAKAKIRAEEIAQGITGIVVDNLCKMIKA